MVNLEGLYYYAEEVTGCTISEGARWEVCLPATGRQQMQHAPELAEHTDHLLRFSFIASIRVERPSAGNDQKKMVVLRYGAPQSVCFPEIALGLGLSTVRSRWSHARGKKRCACERSQATLTHFNDSVEFSSTTWCLSVEEV